MKRLKFKIHQMAPSRAHFIISSMAVIVVALSGCGNSAPDKVSDAPRLDFECSIAQALGCDSSNSGKPVFIGLHENSAVNCTQQLSFYNGSQLINHFNYSSWTITSTQGGILNGIATHWVNSNEMHVAVIPNQAFKLCAYIDFNHNGQLDLNEPFAESTLTIGAAFLPLSNWSNY